MKSTVLVLLLTSALAMNVQAAVVADTLPYKGTPIWTDIVFSNTSMTTDGGKSTLITSKNQGVWFGWGATYGDVPSSWSPGTNAVGNHFSLTASFSAGATDWSAYFYDGARYASFTFNSTYTHHNCSGNGGSCYGIDLTETQQGVTFSHAESGGKTSTFVALDMSQTHAYEFLLKGSQVAYRIDGQVVFAGEAFDPTHDLRLLVVGDGSGSTPTGRGSMTVYGVSFDNAPSMNTLVSAVPEPETRALMLSGLGLVGFVARRRT